MSPEKSPEIKGVMASGNIDAGVLPGRKTLPVERKKEKEPVPPKEGGHALRNTALILTGMATGAAGVMSADSHLTNKTPLDARAILVDDVYHGIPETAQKYWHGIIGLFGFQTTPETDTPVPSTFTEIIDSKALDHATGKDGTPLDQLTNTRLTASETLFQATINGAPVSPDTLSFLLKDAVKPYNNETGSADVKMLFLVKNPGDQKITLNEIAFIFKGYDGPDAQGNFKQTVSVGSWEKGLIIPNKDTILVMPLDGALNNAEIFKIASHKGFDGRSYFNGIVIRFTGPDETKYELFITNDEYANNPYQTISSASILPDLADAPEIGKNGFYANFDPKYADIKGKPLPAGTEILKTIHSNGNLRLSLRANKPGAAAFDFILSQQKLVYLP